MSVSFRVPGTPIPKGSARSYVSKRGKLSTVQSNRDKLVPWEAAVAWRAKAAGLRPHVEPCSIALVFTMPRPKGHYGARGMRPSAPQSHTTKPDLDKLIRAVLDALTGIAWMDDSQVLEISASKRYADEGETTGAEITVKQKRRQRE